MRTALVCFAASLSCLPTGSAGCAAPSPTTIPNRAPVVYDVSWLALARDHQTAESYVGYTVRVRLLATEYAHESGELRVWAGLRDVPPVLVFRLAAPLPADSRTVVVVGVVRSVVRDGQWRSPRADFVVLIDGATAAAVP